MQMNSGQPQNKFEAQRCRRLIRLKNAAEYLGGQLCTLRAWFLARKNLDYVKVGRAVCVTEDSIVRYIARNTIPAAR